MDEIAAPGILAYKAGECFANLVSLINEIPAGRDINSTTLENLLQQYVKSSSPPTIYTTDIIPVIGSSFKVFHTFSGPGGPSACTSAPAALRGVVGGGGKECPNCDDTISTVMIFNYLLCRGTCRHICRRKSVSCMLATVYYILISFQKNCTIIILSRPRPSVFFYISKLSKRASGILPSESITPSFFIYHHHSL